MKDAATAQSAKLVPIKLIFVQISNSFRVFFSFVKEFKWSKYL
jgi:hypothetical protein